MTRIKHLEIIKLKIGIRIEKHQKDIERDYDKIAEINYLIQKED
jgi:hypothetical protein